LRIGCARKLAKVYSIFPAYSLVAAEEGLVDVRSAPTRLSRAAFVTSAAAVSVLPRVASAQTPSTLLVGTAPLDSGIPPLVALRAGFFQRQHIDVNVQSINSGAAMAAAVAGGSLQIAASSLVGLITAHTKGIPFQIVAAEAVYDSTKPTTVLMVKADSPIRTAADLNGKTIASPALGDLQSSTTFTWIEQNGGDSKSVHQVELPPASVEAALVAGRVDAATAAEPRISQILRNGTARVLANVYDVIAKRFLISAEFAMDDFIAANRSSIQAYARAQRQATAYANTHQTQTAAWLADFAKIDVQTILQGRREVFDESLVIDHLQPVIDACVRYKVISKGFDARELISPVVLNLT
jgi:NitT/TauT family transport system substrate-binding protein